MSDEVIAVPIETELDALFGQYVAAEQAPGLVYGLTGPDGLSHWRGFGRFDDSGASPDLDTVFPIASMSKSFAACAALIARDRGLISLDDPIDRHVPEFRLSTAGLRPDGMPTVGMLLSMSGGLTEDNSWVDPFIGMPTDEVLQLVGDGVRLSRPPGAAYEYSNLGFAIACLAVSRALGQPLVEFEAQEILGPLGMTSTFADSQVPGGASLAVGHRLDPEGRWVGYPPAQTDGFVGAVGVLSTVRDLARWVTWLGEALRPARDEQEPVLSRISRRELQRLRIPDAPVLVVGPTGALHSTASGYALGLMVDQDLRHGAVVHHSGGLPGFKLHMRWHPESGYGVVVLTNSHRGNPVALAGEALGRMLVRGHQPFTTIELWPDTLKLCAKTDALIRDWSDELAAQLLAPNVDFDRPVSERRAEIAALIEQIGPLRAPASPPQIVSAITPADVTWSIPGEHGELLCMIHLTPTGRAQVQEIVVRAADDSWPRAARPTDISARRAGWGESYVAPAMRVRLRR